MTETETPTRVAVVREGDLARLRLIAPQRRNAIDQRFVDELAAAVATLRTADGLRALLIEAEGPAFTVGGDLDHIAPRADDLAATLDAMIGGFHAALGELGELDLPVVCAVQGGAAGGGLGLLWVADVVVAADDLKLATGFDRLGLTGDGNSSWWLPRLVGLRRAQELLIEGRVLGAQEAREWGLVTRVVAAAALAEEAAATARRLADGPTVALGRIRRLLRESGDVGVRERLAEEHRAMREVATTEDARAGVRAFVARERPRFRGR
ncbi:enoyl-CoA hydratase/isomerase family protein [Patulibacter defluvii]|uniref:enoyl-CoA hydratase/isomerase family protein n=1 Tax=Patulibacter defluvii TaxID=3095358 RepID=UPI002A75576A|nr:enoyl-CoA hydratase-related protein [Patulibacter sp. DM4]